MPEVPVRRSPARLRPGRYPCPVCLGLVLQSVELGSGLVLDACRRCGGVWFDAGEVVALRACKPEALWAKVELRADAFRMKCHKCHASFKRNDPRCPACGWGNQLACPVCRKALSTVDKDGLRLDVCRTCRGVWFDNTELAEVWNRQVVALGPKPTGAAPAVESDHFLLHALIWAPDPFTLGYLAHGAGDLVGAVGGGAGELLGGAAEATGELAGGVFESIADLLGSLFDF